MLAVLAVLAAACVGPARTPEVYESKAGQAAAQAVSHLRTALLAVRAGTAGRLPSAYEETVLVASEAGIGSVQTSFDSIQPPHEPASDRLQAELDGLLSDAGDGVTALRIAARRGETDTLEGTARHLLPVADKLETFSKEHRR